MVGQLRLVNVVMSAELECKAKVYLGEGTPDVEVIGMLVGNLENPIEIPTF